MRIKTNRERRARIERNKTKRSITQVKKDVFQAVREVVNSQTKLDDWAKSEGLTEDDLAELKEPTDAKDN